MSDTTNRPSPFAPGEPNPNELQRFGDAVLKRAKQVAQRITERVRQVLARTCSDSNPSVGPNRGAGPPA
jgi:hypothetical protein